MRTQANAETEVRPSTTSADTAAPDTATPGTMSFRATSLDEAVALAQESLGAPVRVVSASRIRRGGIGGFFASDLGVEVSVALEDETIEQALERLVSETAADERTRWMDHVEAPDAQRGLVRMPPPPAPTADPAPSATPGASALAAPRRALLSTPKPADSVVRLAQRDEDPSMVRVEQIIEELQYLTRRPEAAADVLAPIVPAAPRAVAVPRLPPRSIDIAQAAAANAAAAQTRALADEAARSIVPTLPVAIADTVHAELELTDGHIEAVDQDEPAGRNEPSQRQVELAVAATDQLIESLQRDGVKRLSVRIVLRTGNQSAVEAEAEWEAQ
jgi:hypothetical protein